jgi:DnaJ family protein B protein 11
MLVSIDLEVTLEQLYSGHFIEILRSKAVLEPAPGTRQCNCRAEMRTQHAGGGQFFMTQMQVCDTCPNYRMGNAQSELDVEIEAGADSGHEIRFNGEGEPHPDGEPGDLVFRLRTQPHARFERRGPHLLTNLSISLSQVRGAYIHHALYPRPVWVCHRQFCSFFIDRQALVGFQATIPHLDGTLVAITSKEIVAPGAMFKVAGRGMPHLNSPQQHGDLFVTVHIRFPKGPAYVGNLANCTEANY